jgi:aminoglycoside/choline kinase family phosphotransferase
MEMSSAKTSTIDLRLQQASAWLQQQDVELQSDFVDIAGDASFRRYFRLTANGKSRVLMDAPTPGENVGPFMDIARRLRLANLHAPEIVYADSHAGFLLLEDLGDELYRGLLDEETVSSLFPGLFDLLKDFAQTISTTDLPVFSEEKLQRDMNLFPEWYLGRHRSSVIRENLEATWDSFCAEIVDSALEQPQCFVHRDFHSCNLLRTASNTIGIIDFQDAVLGPVTYDFVSLIWDRYITWPRGQIESWMEEFRLKLDLDIEPMKWRRYCDLMGLQRNFKIVGIFARLYYRDGKSGYIEMIPRFYDYITSTLRLYPEFSALLDIMESSECAP